MKVFIPMSDAALGDNTELYQKLVPFNPEFLHGSQDRREGHKPSNWVSDCDYERARERLRSSNI